jgi:hypothetical protein
LGLDLEEPIGRTETLDALVGPLVVVIFDPEFDPLPGRFEALELGADQEVLPEALPEPFDLAQGHRMMGPTLEVGDAVLFELGFKAAGAAPGGVLAAVVGEHLLGRRELADGDPIDFDDGRRRGAAEQIGAHDEARVIIQEGDQIRIATAQPEGEDVRLPHLVGRGPLEEAGAGEVAFPGRWRRRHQACLMQAGSDGLGTAGQPEPAAQQLRNAFDPKGRILGFEFQDLLGHCRRQLGGSGQPLPRLQAGFPGQPVLVQPEAKDALAHAQLLTHQPLAEALLQMQFDGAEPQLGRISLARFFSAASPPRGAVPLLLYSTFVIHVDTHFSFECQPLSCSTWSHDLVARTTLPALSVTTLFATSLLSVTLL